MAAEGGISIFGGSGTTTLASTSRDAGKEEDFALGGLTASGGGKVFSGAGLEVASSGLASSRGVVG
jgi:hypothetical protein